MIVNIEKSTNRVVDVGQVYDPRFFDNEEYPDGTIVGDPKKYERRGNQIRLTDKTPSEIRRENALVKLAATQSDNSIPIKVREALAAIGDLL